MNTRKVALGLYRYVHSSILCFYLIFGGFFKINNRSLLNHITEHFSPGENALSLPKHPDGIIPGITVEDVIGCETTVTLSEITQVVGNVSPLELIIISSLARKIDPARSLEIGTFDGRTTLNIALNQKRGTEIITIDLPEDSIDKTRNPIEDIERNYILKASSGSRFVSRELPAKIIQLYGDSAAYDFSVYVNNIDLMFVDGSHSYEYTLSDSLVALSLVRKGGVIIWHDYNTPYWYGVTRALNELYTINMEFRNLKHVENTSICLLCR